MRCCFHQPGIVRQAPEALGDVTATVAVGDAVRVFGRALGWTTAAVTGATSCWDCAAAELVCADAKNTPTTTGTKLVLAAGVTLETTGATCYEARFDTAGVAPGVYNNAVSSC